MLPEKVIRKMRKALGIFVALLTATALVSLWVPRATLRDKSPLQTLVSPEKYREGESEVLPPRWEMIGSLLSNKSRCNQVMPTRPENPVKGDCYYAGDGVSNLDVWLYQSDFKVVTTEKATSRLSAIGVVARDTLRVGLVTLIVALCVALVFGTYRIVAGRTQKESDNLRKL
jgi:hypothetical protein